MASKTNKTTVTHADGTISTRSSKTMVYTHAVEVSPADCETYAASLDRMADDADASAAQLDRAAERGEVKVIDRRLGGGPQYSPDPMIMFEARLIGSTRKHSTVSTWSSREGLTNDPSTYIAGTGKYAGTMPATDYLIQVAREQATADRAQAAKLRAQAAAVRAAGVPVGTFGIARWSTRRDLAAKYADSIRAWAALRGESVRVVEVDA